MLHMFGLGLGKLTSENESSTSRKRVGRYLPMRIGLSPAQLFANSEHIVTE
jgi:hypothetical protein